VIARAFLASLAKDLRLIARDRVGLVFLTLAPIIVITVAGFSLASLYGADPTGQTAYLLPLVDEDGGRVGRAIRERLANETAVEVRAVADREAARRILDHREAGAVLVVPADTTSALESGRGATLLLLTDPVKYLEIANLRALVQELRHGVEEELRRQLAHDLETARASIERDLATATSVGREARERMEALRRRLASLGPELAARRASAVVTARERASAAAARAQKEAKARIEKRLAEEIAPLRAFLNDLSRSEQTFRDWLADVRGRAGKLADKIPPPPEPPSVPPEVARLSRSTPEEIAARIVGDEAVDTPAPPALPDIDLPRLPEIPEIALPKLEEPPTVKLPGGLAIEEASVTGAPRRLNTFDQNVPGFSVTFLLLGMLLGVSLALLDERDWGTFERLRAMPPPLSVVLIAKLASRNVVGILQMVTLFAVGRVAFGISLGPAPAALLLPTAGIVFAGTAFGLVVAGLTDSREAVLPIGSIVIVTMAAVGGCWWPIDLEPRWMRSVALAFPTTWAMAAYNDLMIRRQPLAAALWPTAVLFGFGFGYLVLGLWLFRRRLLARA
jgi:ABC-type multidrug transport system permease subunit